MTLRVWRQRVAAILAALAGVAGLAGLSACAGPHPGPGVHASATPAAVTATGASASSVQQRVDARLALAQAYYADGQYAIALQEVEQALQLAPRNAHALGLRGLVQWQLGEPELALDSVHRALRAEPGSPELQNNLGWMMCQSGKAEQGLAYLDGALSQRRYASPANAAMNAGHCSLRLGDRARAESYFRRALDAEATRVPAQAQLARLAVERGDYAGAHARMLAVVGSEQASADDYAMAVRIERQLGDRTAEQSLVSQWQRRFPDSPQLRAYRQGQTNDGPK